MDNLTKHILVSLIKDYEDNRIRGRRNKCDIGEYLDKIFKVLISGMRWKDLDYGPLHYQTYYKKFIVWSKAGIFDTAHSCLMKILDKSGFFEDRLDRLFIDSSMLKNVHGIDMIGCNHYDRYRKASKISIIVTTEGMILGFKLAKANDHDSSLVQDTLENISVKIVKSRLIGDKGYNSNPLRKQLKEKRNIRLVYPYKKNQKEKLTAREAVDLKDRYVVESSFANIQKYRRLKQRYDKYASNLKSFYSIAILDICCRKLSKLPIDRIINHDID